VRDGSLETCGAIARGDHWKDDLCGFANARPFVMGLLQIF
jgi:hypothetical protein